MSHIRQSFSLKIPVWIAFVVALQAGCGPDHGMHLGRVKGRVLFDGNPVKQGTVMFMPDPGHQTEGASAMAIIKEDGSFVLETAEPGDGAVVGYHKVSVTGLDPTPIATPTPSKEDEEEDEDPGPVNMMKSKLKGLAPPLKGKKKAKRSATETFTDRAGRTFRYLVPKKFANAETSGLLAKVSSGSNTIDLIFKADGSGEVK